MAVHGLIARLKRIDWDPLHWLRRVVVVLGKALARLWGRDFMPYTGGGSFFAMLAIFPALAILIGLYSVLSNPMQAEREAQALSALIPSGARELVQHQLVRLSHAPHEAISTQS